MALKVSTGLRNRMLAVGSFVDAIQDDGGARLRIYSGTPPETADAAVPGGATLLVEISGGGTGAGLQFEGSASGGVLAKDESQSWQGEVEESGEATFFRLVNDADSGSSSSTRPRLQGTVALAGADLNLSSTDLVAAAVQPIGYFVVSLPTL